MQVLVLKTCDTCRKARKWMDEKGIAYEARDVRDAPLSREELAAIVDKTGWEKLLNKSSTTWRGLDEAEKSDVDASKAIELLAAHPTLIKRPVFLRGDDVIIGFRKDAQDALAI